MNWSLPDWVTGKRERWSFSAKVKGPRDDAFQAVAVSFELPGAVAPTVGSVLSELKSQYPEKQYPWLHNPSSRQFQVTRAGSTQNVNLGFHLESGDVVSVFSR